MISTASFDARLLSAICAAVAMYLFNPEIVSRPKVDLTLALATWATVYSILMFTAVVTVNQFWLAAVAVYTLMALIPYKDFMRGLAWSMLVIDIYLFALLQINALTATIVALVSIIEVLNKWREMMKFRAVKSRP